ncbi:hypothetical protein [Leptolyngbya ohadii]|uniref:hypothetical protein n=1 Tax=Leptolyngbya ohadii TaxID=1962290 RepID=UPI000B59C6A1|nr:hypothetical protein [Leptolyngbya ohadii]
MRQLMRELRQMQLVRTFSQMLAIGLMTMILLLTPAFILQGTVLQNTVQAQAASDTNPSSKRLGAPDAPEKRLRVIQAEPNEVDTISPDILKRIQRKAEDLGDGARRDIGDTGLKNLRKLPEKASETADLVKKQRFGKGSQAEPATTKGFYKRG